MKIEICKTSFIRKKIKVKLNHYNVNIDQGQLHFDWFAYHCVDMRLNKTILLAKRRKYVL